MAKRSWTLAKINLNDEYSKLTKLDKLITDYLYYRGFDKVTEFQILIDASKLYNTQVTSYNDMKLLYQSKHKTYKRLITYCKFWKSRYKYYQRLANK